MHLFLALDKMWIYLKKAMVESMEFQGAETWRKEVWLGMNRKLTNINLFQVGQNRFTVPNLKLKRSEDPIEQFDSW